jgi:hypothetical protein
MPALQLVEAGFQSGNARLNLSAVRGGGLLLSVEQPHHAHFEPQGGMLRRAHGSVEIGQLHQHLG